ncbi:hypothetical protein [Sphingomonas hengshuiensis]|uniref:Gene transfer agent family protein n=1 Tax=Sphingomonas hengshuiensis TaxID=1609977 RepID=A0A7U4LFW1_9SPHN|nr:hypothetical protein [Sphingomonas hengshuiensis]AJP72927.1 hypothetical protein TS85_15705 [Sphingomonas hengshuiensis]
MNGDDDLDDPLVEANEVVGEDTLKLGRKTYVLRPGFHAVKAIEKTLGLSLVEMSRMGNLGQLNMDQLGTIAAHFIRAGAAEGDAVAARVHPDRVAELIYEAGIPHVMARLTLLLIDAASGGRTASGERKPVAETAES